MDESKEITLQYIFEHCLDHPAAKLFPRLSDSELQEMADDIEKNGLLEAIALYAAPDGQNYIIDGYNRAMALGLIPEGKRPAPIPVRWIDGDDIPGFIISKNLRRRHLTKEEKADLILQVLRVAEAAKPERNENGQLNELANLARSFSPEPDKRGGSTKDPLKKKLVEEAEKAGISKRTIERIYAKDKGPTLKPRPFKRAVLPKGISADDYPKPEPQLAKTRLEQIQERLAQEQQPPAPAAESEPPAFSSPNVLETAIAALAVRKTTLQLIREGQAAQQQQQPSAPQPPPTKNRMLVEMGEKAEEPLCQTCCGKGWVQCPACFGHTSGKGEPEIVR
jgi:hypothetical protein